MKKENLISIILYFISLVLLSLYVVAELMPHLSLTSEARLVILLLLCLFLYLGGYFLSKNLNDNKPMKINLCIFFILYLILLITLTLFDPMWGRNGFYLNYSKGLIEYYFKTSVNLIPFKTIINYIRNISFSYISTANLFYNLLGNIVCLMPFGLFLPLLFEKIDNTKKYLITVLFVTLGIELSQLLTLSGSFDIDDIILNFLGAYLSYRIINIKDINNLVKNIFLLEKNKINKKKIIQTFIIFILSFTFIFGLIKIREDNYNQKELRWFYEYI